MNEYTCENYLLTSGWSSAHQLFCHSVFVSLPRLLVLLTGEGPLVGFWLCYYLGEVTRLLWVPILPISKTVASPICYLMIIAH